MSDGKVKVVKGPHVSAKLNPTSGTWRGKIVQWIGEDEAHLHYEEVLKDCGHDHATTKEAFRCVK